MNNHSFPLISVFAEPACTKRWHINDWSACLLQAYKVNHVARVYALLAREGLQHLIPPALLWHFTSANEMYQAHKRDFLFTLEHLGNHISALETPVILLKGAAYTKDEESVTSEGRLFADIDVFVDKQYIKSAEQLLMWSGWRYQDKTDYDMSYYLNWMHELPPMTNQSLPLGIDVHHHIVPVIAKTAFELAPLTQSLCRSGNAVFCILSPASQMIHTAMHMLTNDDMHNTFRDLLDFYLNFTHFYSEEFVENLVQVAEKTQTERHLYRALRLIQQLFNCELGEILTVKTSNPDMFERLVDAFYVRLIKGSLLRDDPKRESLTTKMLWIRAHWLKMPLSILLQHGLYKLVHFVKGVDHKKTKGSTFTGN